MSKANAAIGILRVSSKGQKDNTSHETQEQEIRRYCTAQGLDLVECFHLVESAKRAEDRRQYLKARAWALKNKVRHLVFYKYDRETRNLTDNERNEEQVRSGQIVLHYAAENKVLHQDSPNSDFFLRDIQAAAAKQFIRDHRHKVIQSQKTKAEAGWYPGGKAPLGYAHQSIRDEFGKDLKRGTIIVPDPDQRNIRQVLREFELRAERKSLDAIRSQVIAEGFVPIERATKYRANAIEKRLKNRFYAGYFEWDGNEYKGRHDLIIPKDLWNAVQASFGLQPYRKSNGVFGGGWLKCGDKECGCNIVYDPKTKHIVTTGETKTFHYYHCTNGRKVHTKLKNVSETAIWQQLEPAVDGITITKDFAEEIADALSETHRKAIGAIRKQMGAYKDAQRALEAHEDKAYEHMTAGIIGEAMFKRQLQKIREERERIEGLLELANVQISDASHETAKSILELATNAK